jgi:hypothetical protein
MKNLLIFLLTTSVLFSAPSFNQLREYKNADGTLFKARQQGDEYLNWIETPNGDILEYNNQTKNFDYVEIKNGELKASGEKYQNSSALKVKSRTTQTKLSKDSLYELWNQKRAEARAKRAVKP